MKIIIRGNYRVGKTTMVKELLKEIGPGAGFYTENVSVLMARLCHRIIAQRTDGFGGRGKKTGSDIVPLSGSFLGGALLRFFRSKLFCLASATTTLYAPMYCSGRRCYAESAQSLGIYVIHHFFHCLKC